MARRFVLSLVIAVLLFAPVATTAGQELEPAGKCPSNGGWNLIYLSEYIPYLDNGNGVDHNGDGFLCARINAGRSKKLPVEYVYTVIDNFLPLGE
jgi:hypothetical protein